MDYGYRLSVRGVVVGVIVTFIIMMLVLAGLTMVASADSVIPEGVEVFHVEDRTCIRDVELGELICWCTDSCEGCEEPIVKPTPRPDPTDVPPTDVPEPTPTEKPPKLKCNKGDGNLGEGCDPGNHPEKGNDDED